MWNEALSKATDAEKTWDGPAKSVQIPMPSGDGFKALTIVGTSNEFSLSSEARKLRQRLTLKLIWMRLKKAT